MSECIDQTKTPALKLAAFWTMKNDQGEYLYSSLDFREETAAELRRLVEENQRLRGIVPEVLERLNDELCEENERLKSQRDLLLRTLKDCEIVLRTVAKDDDEFVLARQQVRDIRAALKAVEE